MTYLRDRPRLARAIERAARAVLARVVAPEPPPPPPPPPPPDTGERFVRTLPLGHLGSEQARATNLLYARLSAADVDEVQARIGEDPEVRELYANAADETVRKHMVLAFGIWLDVPCVAQKTGLATAQPPEDVHVMARGPTAAAGGLYEADFVLDALASSGADLAAMRSGLDFGCSSGRVLRVLAAACPQLRWHGCDPNGPAIQWARENLSHIDFSQSGNEPPLPLPDGSLDLVYAISIWSHFARDLGERWFEEMYRLLRPGGHLVFTTHGLTSVALYAGLGLRTLEQSDEIMAALYQRGFWYAPEFGEQGDWGVVNPEWGTAFLSPEWVLANLCPRWQVLEFASGRNQENQDVYVLRRV